MKYKLCVAIVFTVLTGQALCMEKESIECFDGQAKEKPEVYRWVDFTSHEGEWRGEQMENCKRTMSATDDGTMLCAHGSEVITRDHWSCCGELSKDSPHRRHVDFKVGDRVVVRRTYFGRTRPKGGWMVGKITKIWEDDWLMGESLISVTLDDGDEICIDTDDWATLKHELRIIEFEAGQHVQAVWNKFQPADSWRWEPAVIQNPPMSGEGDFSMDSGYRIVFDARGFNTVVTRRREHIRTPSEGTGFTINFTGKVWGFGLESRDLPWTVGEVNTQSQAETAGLKVGYILTHVNGVEVTDVNEEEIFDILIKGGDHTIAFRGESEMEFSSGEKVEVWHDLLTWHAAVIETVQPDNTYQVKFEKSGISKKRHTNQIRRKQAQAQVGVEAEEETPAVVGPPPGLELQTAKSALAAAAAAAAKQQETAAAEKPQEADPVKQTERSSHQKKLTKQQHKALRKAKQQLDEDLITPDQYKAEKLQILEL